MENKRDTESRKGKDMSSHHQVTHIFDGRVFDPNVDSGEYFSCFTKEVSQWKDKAIKALKTSARNLIPEKEMKNVIFDSVESFGRTTFMWRYGRDWWTNDLHQNNQVKNRQVYK